KGGKKAAKPAPVKAEITTETTLDIRRVLDLLPHRYPFVMIDRVVELHEMELTAIKNVTINEPFFQGHYPGNPVMPGVLQVEAMAQAAGILLLRQADKEGKTALFMSCDKVKWRKPVRPGDQLLIKVKMTKVRGTVACAEGECTVNGQVVSSAELMFAVVDNNAME
ncbi:MAG: 3-hydroxyacyl-ACP dehydratase FabZ, partial [Oleiharenicola lentus]